MRTGWTKAVALAQVYHSQTLLAQVLHTQTLFPVLQLLRDGSYHWSLCWLHMAWQICGKTAETPLLPHLPRLLLSLYHHEKKTLCKQ